MLPRFEKLPHTADLKLKMYGVTLSELFENALFGMFQSIKPQSDVCPYLNDEMVCPHLTVQHTFSLTAPTTEILLVDFLSEALYLSDIHNEAYLQAQLKMITPTSLAATIKGVPISGFEVSEIKAVTFNELSVKKENEHWSAIVVFDL